MTSPRVILGVTPWLDRLLFALILAAYPKSVRLTRHLFCPFS
jgi:hypothetical protein